MSGSQISIFVGSIIILLSLVLLSMSVGAGAYGMQDFVSYLFHNPIQRADEQLVMIIETLRLPRTAAACMVGICLALAASLLQSATRNPLAEPGLLGVNAGAVLGLVIGLSFFGVESTYGYLIWSGTGALFGNTVVLLIAHMMGQASPLKLILAGVALNASLGGIANYILLSKKVALEQFRFWNLGSLSASEMSAVLLLLPFALTSVVITFLLARQLTLMQLGDLQAKSLGISTQKVRFGVLIAASIFTASAISVAGPISFVGLLAAYCARMVEPINLSRQVIFSGSFGVVFLLISDVIARWIIQPYEMPNGVILAMVGAPLLIWVVLQGGFRSMLVARQ